MADRDLEDLVASAERDPYHVAIGASVQGFQVAGYALVSPSEAHARTSGRLAGPNAVTQRPLLPFAETEAQQERDHMALLGFRSHESRPPFNRRPWFVPILRPLRWVVEAIMLLLVCHGREPPAM